MFKSKDKPFLLFLPIVLITLCFACVGGLFSCLYEITSFGSISVMILACSCFSFYIVSSIVLSIFCLIHYRRIVKNENI